uniref:Uncharacterized protein n=1 Tax=Aegilops tauschii subsp. strangulata TaxID=200361 RepID=A0A453F3F1_AEGTS
SKEIPVDRVGGGRSLAQTMHEREQPSFPTQDKHAVNREPGKTAGHMALRSRILLLRLCPHRPSLAFLSSLILVGVTGSLCATLNSPPIASQRRMCLERVVTELCIVAVW